MNENSFNITPSTIGYIISGVIGLILLISAITGFKRGLGKAMFRFLWVLVTVVILFFITPSVSSWLNNFDLSSYGLNIFGEVNKLSDIGLNIFHNMGLTEYMDNSPALLDFASNISVIILNILVFILLFWLTKWILGIPYAIISAKTFDKNKKELKKYKKKIKDLKRKGLDVNETADESPLLLEQTNKHRVLGMLFGVLLGFIICISTLFPLVGINSLYQEVYASITTTNEEDEEVPYLSTAIDAETSAYINSYENSIGALVMKYTGMSFMSNFIFDSMAQTSAGGQNIALSNEVTVALNVYKRVMTIEEIVSDIDNASQQDLTLALTYAKEIFIITDRSVALSAFGDDLLPYIIEKEFINKTDVTINIGDEDYTDMIKEAYNNFKLTNTVNVANIKAQVEAIIDIASLLNKNGLVLPMIRQEISSPTDALDMLSNNVVNSTTFAENLVNYIYNITMFNHKYSEFIDSFVEMGFESAGITGFTSKSDMTDLKDSLKTIIKNILYIMKAVNSHPDFDFGTEQTAYDTLSYAGEALDAVIGNIISEESYNSLLDFIENKLTEEATDFGDITTVFAEFRAVESWKTELKSLAPLYNTIVKIVTKNENTNGVEYSKELDFEKILDEEFPQLYDIGLALQQTVGGGSSKIITNENIRNIFVILLNRLNDEGESTTEFLDDIIVEDADGNKTIRTLILDNIWDTTEEETAIENWGNELKYSLTLISKVSDIISDFDSARISSAENTELAELGEAIDDAIANTKLFMSNKTMRAFMEYFLDERLGDESLSGELNTIFTDQNFFDGTTSVKDRILQNIYNINLGESQINSWENEFSYLKRLFASDVDAEDNTEKLTKVGKLFDDIALSKMIDREIVKQIITHYIDINTQTAEFSGGLTGEDSPVGMIMNIISAEEMVDGEYKIKYESELGKLLGLVDVLSDTYIDGEETAERNKFYAIGDYLNTLFETNVLTGVLTENSYLLTRQVINEFLIYYIHTFIVTDASLQNVIDQMPYDTNALNEITSYKTEFRLLLDVVDKMKDSTATLQQIGETINNVRQQNSHFITKTAVDDLIEIYISSKVQEEWADEAGIVNVIALINENIKNSNVDPNAVGHDYNALFAELSTISDYFVQFSAIDSKSSAQFENNENVGTRLDSVRAMIFAGGTNVAKELAGIFIDKIKSYVVQESVSAGHSETYGEGFVDNILVSLEYLFMNFDVEGVTPQPTHLAQDYYEDLFTDILAINVNP